MTLIEQIRNEAVGGKTSLTSLLRKCQILASTLRNQDFKRWVSCELNGYGEEDAIPPYRRLAADSVGNFSGYGGRFLRNQPIPMCNLPEELAEKLSAVSFKEGVGSLEHLLENSQDGQLVSRWPSAVIARYQAKFIERFVLMEAFMVVSRAEVAGILETIRNRILEFVLELGEKYPDKSFEKPERDVESGVVKSIVNNYIYGNGNRVASGSGASNDISVSMAKGNWEMLSSALSELGLSTEDIDKLGLALKAEPPTDEKHLGKNVSSWIGAMMTKIGKGAYDLSIGTAAGVISSAISRYCGF